MLHCILSVYHKTWASLKNYRKCHINNNTTHYLFIVVLGADLLDRDPGILLILFTNLGRDSHLLDATT